MNDDDKEVDATRTITITVTVTITITTATRLFWLRMKRRVNKDDEAERAMKDSIEEEEEKGRLLR